MFHFAVAQVGATSLWIDYVPSESNPADTPSRAHEMDSRTRARELAELGKQVPMRIPTFADTHGEWMSFTAILRSIFSASWDCTVMAP